MDRSTMLQVADHGDRQPIHRPDLVSYRENVEQRLSGVFPNTVAGIQQRFSAVLGGSLNSHIRYSVRLKYFHSQNKKLDKHLPQWR